MKKHQLSDLLAKQASDTPLTRGEKIALTKIGAKKSPAECANIGAGRAAAFEARRVALSNAMELIERAKFFVPPDIVTMLEQAQKNLDIVRRT